MTGQLSAVVTAAPMQIYAVWCTVNSCAAYSSDLDPEPLWLVLHSKAINANQAVGCSRFDVIIEIPVVLLLSPGTQPPPPTLSSLLNLPTPLSWSRKYRPAPSSLSTAPLPDHTNAEKVIYAPQSHPLVKCCLLMWGILLQTLVSHRVFCKQVALNRDIKLNLQILFVQYDF